MKPQTADVLDRLRVGPITQMQALRELGVARLSSRVHELRDSGYVVYRELIRVPSRRGLSRIAVYSLGADHASR